MNFTKGLVKLMSEEAIVALALDQPDPAARAAFLAEACGPDGALRRRVEALLWAHEQGGDRRRRPAVAESLDSPSGAGTTHVDREDALAFLAPSQEAGSLGRLDEFEVLELLGQGGMGVVLKARDTKLQRIDAIKLLAPQLAANGIARRRFAREAQAAAAVRDPHVVAIHGVHEDGHVPYLVMEFVDGITLDERLRQSGTLAVKEVLRIGVQAALGLAAAHAQGLIHRDVKPGNILLENGQDRVKITDFGLARAADDASITQSGVIAGTPMYMSPEQARGEHIDHRSDLFSLGSVLYTLCAGHPAFRADNSIGVLTRVCEDVPRPIRESNPDVPNWLCAVIGKLLAKKPEDRIQTAAEVADLLGRFLAHLEQPDTVPPPPPVAGVGAWEPRRGHKRMLLAGAVAVAAVVAVAVGGYLALRPGDSPKPRDESSGNGQEQPRLRTLPTPADLAKLAAQPNPLDLHKREQIPAALRSPRPRCAPRPAAATRRGSHPRSSRSSATPPPGRN
jgi:serine/threonine protein kinase